MGQDTKIEWATHTFNPWIGCTKVSPACAHCYAEAFSKRTGKAKWGDNGTRVVTSAKYWQQPAKWNRAAEKAGTPVFVFCASMADVFEDWQGAMLIGAGGDQDELRRCPTCGWLGTLPLIVRELAKRTNVEGCPNCDNDVDTLTDVMVAVRHELFTRVIPATPWLTWLLLTKRPHNVRDMVTRSWLERWPANVWVGTTVESQEQADRRIPELLAVPCRTRFLSCEPLLGPLDLRRGVYEHAYPERIEIGIRGTSLDRIHWVIAGGESGPGARPMFIEWARSLRDQCQAAGVPFFFKQWGDHDGVGVRMPKKQAGRLLDGILHNDRPAAVAPGGTFTAGNAEGTK